MRVWVRVYVSNYTEIQWKRRFIQQYNFQDSEYLWICDTNHTHIYLEVLWSCNVWVFMIERLKSLDNDVFCANRWRFVREFTYLTFIQSTHSYFYIWKCSSVNILSFSLLYEKSLLSLSEFDVWWRSCCCCCFSRKSLRVSIVYDFGYR